MPASSTGGASRRSENSRQARQAARAAEAARVAAAERRKRLTFYGVGIVAVALIALVGFLFVGSSDDEDTSASAAAGEVTLLDPRSADELINQRQGDPDFEVLDVRTPGEYAEGHIDGATNIDWESGHFSEDVSALDKDKTYVVYCRSGNRSGDATAEMRDLGFTDINDIDGGISAWQAAGLSLTR